MRPRTVVLLQEMFCKSAGIDKSVTRKVKERKKLKCVNNALPE